MFDFGMIGASLVHALFLIGSIGFFCWRWRLPKHEWPFVVLLLLWVTLVFTSQAASLTKTLGSLSSYVFWSLPSLGTVLVFFRLAYKRALKPALMAPVKLELDILQNPKTRQKLFWFLALTLGLFTIISLVLGMSVYPDNADSIIYRLPRAFWYVSKGSFMHPFDVLDKRLVFYPLDGVALYIPFVLYGLPGTFHVIPSLFAWGMVVYTSYVFARELGGDKLLALFSAWLVGLTPSILAQAISTNDEILAAATILCCLYMAYRWLITGRPFYFFLAAVAIALSAGTKLHIVFLLPVVVLLFVLLLKAVLKERALLGRIRDSLDGRVVFLSIVMVIVLFTPFLFYNYASVGRFYFFDDFKKDVFNLSAQMQVGWQNLLIYFSQMMFSPIADMNFWPDTPTRQVFNYKLNEIFTPLIKPLIDENPNFFHLGYRFVGVTIPVSVKFVEFSLWSAFVWLLWPWQAALALQQKTTMRHVLLIIALTPLIWLVCWSFLTLYMEGTATYFTFYLICAAPVAVLIFSQIKSDFWCDMRWLVVGFVALSNLLISHNLVMYSGFRALPDLVYAKGLPYDWLHLTKPIIDEIRMAERLRVVLTHEKMPFFGYMHWNPKAKHLSPYEPDKTADEYEEKKTLNLLPVSSLNAYGQMPVKVPGKLDIGATFLGIIRAIGPEAMFAMGNGVEKRYPSESDYLIFRSEQVPTDKGVHLVIGRDVIGFSQHDRLLFAYEITQGGRLLYKRAPAKTPLYEVALQPLASSEPLALTIIISSSWNLKEITRMTYQLGGPRTWLPEAGEY
ncbi:MAG: phospholipid carrier-dependent glycosyltransferase [Bdellovibrionales bacterium]